MSDRDKKFFKTFAEIIKDNKNPLTEGERWVQEAPYATKDGNPFNTTITLIDRAFYKPNDTRVSPAIERMDSYESADEYVNKTYTRYEPLDRTLNEVGDFFDDARYDMNLGNVSVTKGLNPNLSVSANVDFIGNVGVNLTRRYGGILFDGGMQYKPEQNEGRISLNYSDKINSASTSIYINDYNPGAMTSYTKHLNGQKSVGAGVSVFRAETNAFVKYRQNNTAFTLYGSVKEPYVGVSGRITF